MPYPYYTKMSRDDVLAIRAYLNTVAPVHQAVSNPTSCRFRSTSALAHARVWDALYFTEGEFQPDPGKSAEWNRGAYLVEGPGHCGACHTPKTLLGGDKTSSMRCRACTVQGWFAPDITNDSNAQGLGQLVDETSCDYLEDRP